MERDELERRLALRTAELEAAHRRIEELSGKVNALRKDKQKLTAAKDERDALRASAEYRFGRKLMQPFRKLAKAFGGAKPQPQPPQNPHAYHQWFLAHRAQPADLERMRAGPMPATLISIAMPTYNTPLPMLEEAIASVRAQLYPHWELLVADDASDDPRIPERLRALAAEEPRIRVQILERNQGIALATNAALEMARGEFVGLLDHDDWLEHDALFHIAQNLDAADLIYTDEDKIDADGIFHQPFFKPDWSPDALLSSNYLCHFTVMRRSLLEKIGGFRTGYDGAQDFDLFLRATEAAGRIAHVPRVLYHWRVSSHSTAGAARQKPAAIEAGARALRDALERRGIAATVENVGDGARYRVRRVIAEKKKIAILIPTRDRLELLSRCVESIVARTDYPHFEIVIIDNGSQDPATLKYYETTPHRVLRYPGPFNYSAINNYAVRETSAPWLLFLNNDMEVIEPGWLAAMAEHAQRPEVGAVGARLLYPDDTVQHAGVLLTEDGVATHAYCHAPRKSMENGGHLQLIRNYSAVTAACMLTRRAVFEQVGGFDEQGLPITFSDVDYCLKLRKAGYLIVYTPFATLYHYESVSRGRGKSDPAQGRLMRQRWGQCIARDPYGRQAAP